LSDMLATAADLRGLLKEDETSLPDTEATILLELATGAVQGAARQDLVEYEDDVITLMGTHDQWFSLPQRPVTVVTSVLIDGDPVTDFKRFGDRLWRRHRWARCRDEPSSVEVTYSHGYYAGHPRLQPARSAVLALAARMFANPIGAVGMSIDDYKQQFAQSAVADLAGVLPPIVTKSLRQQYGPRGRLSRIG
jgi:hypothetical protein